MIRQIPRIFCILEIFILFVAFLNNIKMANTDGTDTGVSPDGSTNVGLHNQQQNSNDSQEGSSMSKKKETMVCFNCFKMRRTKKKCRNPTYCKACREGHIPGS